MDRVAEEVFLLSSVSVTWLLTAASLSLLSMLASSDATNDISTTGSLFDSGFDCCELSLLLVYPLWPWDHRLTVALTAVSCRCCSFYPSWPFEVQRSSTLLLVHNCCCTKVVSVALDVGRPKQ